MTHILQDAGPYTLALNWLVAGDATNVGTVTIGITDAAGTAVVAPSTSTSYSSSTATYSYTLADRADPALLNVTWTRSDTGADLQQTIEVVGSELFNERDARSFDNSKLTSASVYTEAAIAAERIRIGEMFERWTGRSWIERYNRMELSGSGDHELFLGDGYSRSSDGRPLQRPGANRDVSRLLSVTIGGVAQTVTNFSLLGSILWREGSVWTQPISANPLNVVVEYVYGLPYASEGSDRMALLLLVDHLAKSKLDARTTSFSDD